MTWRAVSARPYLHVLHALAEQLLGARAGRQCSSLSLSRHVVDTRFEPSFLELTGVLCRGEHEQRLPGPTLELPLSLMKDSSASALRRALMAPSSGFTGSHTKSLHFSVYVSRSWRVVPACGLGSGERRN